MALAITDRGVAQTAAGGAITMSCTSSTFSPAAGCLLAVCVTLDCKNDLGTSDAAVTITDNIGDTGGGAWTAGPTGTRGTVLLGQYPEQARIFTRVIGTSPGASKTVTVTATFNSGVNTTTTDGWVWANVVEITGQHASPIGTSTGTTGRQTAGPTSLSQALGASPASTSLMLGVIHGDNTSTVPTLPSGYTGLQEAHPAWGAESRAAYRNGSGASPVAWTGLATGSNYLGSAIEIVAAVSDQSAPLPVADLTLAGVALTASPSGDAPAPLDPAGLALTGLALAGSPSGNATAALDAAVLTFAGVALAGSSSGDAPAAMDAAALSFAGVALGASPSGDATATLDPAALVLVGLEWVPSGSGDAAEPLPAALLVFAAVALNGTNDGTQSAALPPAALSLSAQPLDAAGTGDVAAVLDPATLTLAAVALDASGSGAVSAPLAPALLVLFGVQLVAAGSTPPVFVGVLLTHALDERRHTRSDDAERATMAGDTTRRTVSGDR